MGKTLVVQAQMGEDPQAKRQAKREIPMLAELVQSRYLPYVQENKRSWNTDKTMLRVHILPVLGTKPVDTITSEQVAALVLRMKNKGYAPGTVNRAIILLRFIFKLARKWKVLGVGYNPTADQPLAPTFHRERFLTKEELRDLLHSLKEDENQVAAHAILLLLLTGARRNEVTYAKWEYIDWQNQTLFVPLSKSGKPRHIALNKRAIALLQAVESIPGNPTSSPARAPAAPHPRSTSPGRASATAPD